MIVAQEKKGTTVEINRYYNGLTALTIVLVPICILGFPVLIPLLISKPVYLLTIPLFPFIALTYLLRAARLYFAMPYTATKYTKPLPFYYLAITTVKIGSLFLLIRFFGLYGVIGATWLSYVTEIVILYSGIRARFTFRFNVLKILAGPLMVTLLIIVLEPWLAGAHPFIAHGSYLFLTLLMLGWVYRTEIKAIDPSTVLR
jgi:O-antigen/teichoic acid export membrane protein